MFAFPDLKVCNWFLAQFAVWTSVISWLLSRLSRSIHVAVNLAPRPPSGGRARVTRVTA